MPKKTPQRMCVSCKEMKDKKELIRIVSPKDADIFIDTGGKANGRGAYICPDEKCIETAWKNGRLSRALRSDIPKSIWDELTDLAEGH